MPGESALQIKRRLSAPRERVFQAWTQPEALKQWFAPSEQMTVPVAETDVRVGGSYRIEMRSPEGEQYPVFGEYREVVEPEKLVFTWQWEGDEHHTLVTVELHEIDNATELVLTHEQFPNADSRDRHNEGWLGCAERLANWL